MIKALSILVMLGVPAAFWNYYLREVPDVKWSISTALTLPPSLLSAGTNKQNNEYIQQIEVANSGNAEAKDIVIKLPVVVTQYVITKHTSNDHVTESKTSSNVELTYDDLPPAGGYQITVMTSGSPLSAEQIGVSHKSGKARYISPSSSNTLSYFGSIFSTLMTLIYLFFLVLSLRDYLKYQLIFQKYSKNIKVVLAMKKPWYLPAKDWPELQLNLINYRLEMTPGTYYPISQSEAFILLSSERPNSISEGEWDNVKNKAAKLCISHAESKALDAANKAEIIDLLSINLPSGMPEKNKEEYQKRISTYYVDVALADTSMEELASLLVEENKPIMLHSRSWDYFKLKASDKIADNIRATIVAAKGLVNLESELAWKVMSYSNKQALLELNNGMIATANIKAEREALNKERENWAFKSSDVNIRESAIKLEEEKIKEHRSRVRQQLDAIDRAIKEPEYLSRIEPDNDLFVPGNWALLRKLINQPA